MRRAIPLLATLILSNPVGAQPAVTVEQLPAPVQKALHERRGDQPIKRIQPREMRGKIVYDIELDIPRAVNRHVRIAENGEILADTRPSSHRARPASTPRH
jgi:hypothetical protein